MEKIKVGDRVEIVNSRGYIGGGLDIGCFGTVSNVYGYNIMLKPDCEDYSYYFEHKDVRLVGRKIANEEQTSLETQKKQVLAHLQHSPITSWEAINTYRITRLSAVIHELRKTLTITSEWESNELTKKGNEKAKRWTKYTLIK